MLSSIKQLCLKYKIPRFNGVVRQMSNKKKEQPLKFEIGTGENKKVYDVIDTQETANTFYNWFATVKGQRVVGSVWIGLSAVGALYHVAPHWFFLNNIRAVYQSYSRGFKTQVGNQLLEIVNEVAKDMNFTDEEITTLAVFMSTLDEPKGWGEFGKESLLGLPDYFNFNTVGEVPMDRMRIGAMLDSGGDNTLLSPAQIESEQGQQFARSLVLSNNAKKFGIAREIERMKTQPFMMNGVFNFGFILLTYNIGRIINKQFQLMRRPPLFRGIAYIFILPAMMLR